MGSPPEGLFREVEISLGPGRNRCYDHFQIRVPVRLNLMMFADMDHNGVTGTHLGRLAVKGHEALASDNMIDLLSLLVEVLSHRNAGRNDDFRQA